MQFSAVWKASVQGLFDMSVLRSIPLLPVNQTLCFLVVGYILTPTSRGVMWDVCSFASMVLGLVVDADRARKLSTPDNVFSWLSPDGDKAGIPLPKTFDSYIGSYDVGCLLVPQMNWEKREQGLGIGGGRWSVGMCLEVERGWRQEKEKRDDCCCRCRCCCCCCWSSCKGKWSFENRARFENVDVLVRAKQKSRFICGLVGVLRVEEESRMQELNAKE